MDEFQTKKRDIPAIVWPIVLGGVGFAAGFFGPIAFNPEANQGPLFGIFISGPGGVVLGLLLWAACKALRVAAKKQLTVMMSLAVLFGLATLGVCFPEPQLEGYAIEVQIEKCEAPTQAMDSAIDYWNGRIAKVTWAAPRAGWQQDARANADVADGVVLDAVVLRESRISENRKPWNNGKLSATAWESKSLPKSYYAEFAGKACEDYPVGKRVVLFSPYEVTGMSRGAGDWPPRKLADFLNRAVLEKVPDEYQQSIPK